MLSTAIDKLLIKPSIPRSGNVPAGFTGNFTWARSECGTAGAEGDMLSPITADSSGKAAMVLGGDATTHPPLRKTRLKGLNFLTPSKAQS